MVLSIRNSIICMLSLFFLATLNAQNFQRIENVSGLEVLEENNGVAIADIDGDYDLDIFVVAIGKDRPNSPKTTSRLFRNNNDGSFTDITKHSGLVNLFIEEELDNHYGLDGYKYGAYWGDYDNDGFPDIFFTYASKLQLFHNNGNGTFKDVSETSGIDTPIDCKITSSTWFDYNNDSYLDLVINEWGNCGETIMYQNEGDGTFTSVSIKDDNDGPTFNMIPFDFNMDGYQDIYITKDLNDPNDLFINLGSNNTPFENKASNYGLASTINDMGITVGDFNLDGFFDFFITGISVNVLFQNDGTNHFSEVSRVNEVKWGSEWSWGAQFADFDLDGDEDLFIVNGFSVTDPQRNVYYKNLYKEGNNKFEDISEQVGLNDLSRSMEGRDFDFDNDGDLDIFVTCTDRPSFFYENKLINAGEPSELKWFKVVLEGTVSNRSAYGTSVAIKTSNGDYVRYFTGVGMLSQSLIPVHFGLGQSTKIDELEISWPSGLVETYQDINANTLVKVTEGQGYEVINTIQPSEKIPGCTDPNSCNYNPLATVNDYSCIYVTSAGIEGSTESGFNSIETYRYGIESSESIISWTVEGGELIDGQGTNSVTVKWGLERDGEVSAIENNGECISELVKLEVDLNINNISKNVSVARIWNEALLEAIRKDYARPTIHARNLFHTSIAFYDAWAIHFNEPRTYLIGNTLHGYESAFNKFVPQEGKSISIDKAISYAAYRILTHRFKNSPGAEGSLNRFDLLMEQLGYDSNYISIDYSNGDAAALGNFIGQTVIDYGTLDKSRENSDYDNEFYEPINPPLDLNQFVNTDIGNIDANRWQPLSFNTFVDQSGNLVRGGITPRFLSPEWGNVYSFSLSETNKSTYQRDNNEYSVYHDPGTPPYLDEISQNPMAELYKWNFSLVSVWSSHLDPNDGVLWDISPKSIGNIDFNLLPTSITEHPNFYPLKDGGDISIGYDKNPVTDQPYEEQIVPRADYARVLAEFWADGPDSETPPGHWFTILNYVSDHELFDRRFNDKGAKLSPLEWDVKAYFILSGAVHDAAITAWSIKGWYDYIRPISAIRRMCKLGQSTDQNLPSYHAEGIPLEDGFVEVIDQDDPLSGDNNENVGKIKLYAWKGHDFIDDPKTEAAGVDWILAKNWWPYQRPTFVTPPFAGYVSGHSTFSRAAAEVLTLITGDEYFPGGMGQFKAKKNEFLVFEEGPTVDVTLQWATYRDASDQCSLSRIWGGIHPPVDDIPGRIIGKQVGIDAYNFAIPYFTYEEPSVIDERNFMVYPNPVSTRIIYIKNTLGVDVFNLFDIQGKSIPVEHVFDESKSITIIKLPNRTKAGVYFLNINNNITKLLVLF